MLRRGQGGQLSENKTKQFSRTRKSSTSLFCFTDSFELSPLSPHCNTIILKGSQRHLSLTSSLQKHICTKEKYGRPCFAYPQTQKDNILYNDNHSKASSWAAMPTDRVDNTIRESPSWNFAMNLISVPIFSP